MMRAADGIRTHDLLHGKWSPTTATYSRGLLSTLIQARHASSRLRPAARYRRLSLPSPFYRPLLFVQSVYGLMMMKATMRPTIARTIRA
jgi:hypothetical protein